MNQICRAHEVADAQAGAVIIFPCEIDSESLGGDGWGESGDAGEGGEGETDDRKLDVGFILRLLRLSGWGVRVERWKVGSYLVRENNEGFLDAKIANGLKFGFREDLAKGVVAGLVSVYAWVPKERMLTGY